MDVVPKILDVICRTTGMGFAAVARVTEDRWIACAVRDDIGFGLPPGGELEVESTICHEIRQHRGVVAFDEASCDPHFREHHTTKQYGLQSYISVPIVRRNGEFFGTLCAIDPKPAKVNNPDTIQTFELFASLIGAHLETSDRLVASESARHSTEMALTEERALSDLRERFIAVLGHDLRTPLAAIDATALVLLQPNLPAGMVPQMALRIRKSAARMSGMIGNVLDFARGSLAGGLVLERQEPQSLDALIGQVVEEARALNPERTISSTLRLETPVSVDQGRLSQLLSNLLTNAIVHGDPVAPVAVRGETNAGRFLLSVSNSGQAIDAGTIEKLFHPFTRGAARKDDSGLGLGLYIASEIAKAHGGELSVESGDAETRFTANIPIS
jgi:signal transduction histidine kinase